jgi:hypothetical protein
MLLLIDEFIAVVHILPVISLIQRSCGDGLQESGSLFLSLDSITQHRRDNCLPDICIGTVNLVRA